jgi:hypothetical protein
MSFAVIVFTIFSALCLTQESKGAERQAAIDSIVERNPEAFKCVSFPVLFARDMISL